MRFVVLLFLASLPLTAQTQSDIWKQVNPLYNGPRLRQAQLSQTQERAIARLTLQCCSGGFEAPGDALKDLVQCLNFEEIPLAPKQNVLLVSEDGTGCAHWGSGGGGGMMLIRLDGDNPVLLASPEDDFNGWLYSIQSSMSHGYYDLVLGWHLGADETTLTYFRFDGKSYQSISEALDIHCYTPGRGQNRIVSNPPPVLTDKELARICSGQ